MWNGYYGVDQYNAKVQDGGECRVLGGREGGGRIFCCMYMYCGEGIITKGKEWCKTDTSGRIKRGGWGVRMRKTVRGGKKIT